MLPVDTNLPCAKLELKEADKLFFSESPKKIAQAKALCGQCPAITKCLEYALDQEIEFGIFGGTTPQERKVML
jgi:WhiB family redox-sensing transcriptional regulator